MWGIAQIKYAGQNAFSRGLVSLHTPGWVHLITYPRETQDDAMVLMSYPQGHIEVIEWLEIRLNPFEKDGLKGAKELLDKYRHVLYPAEADFPTEDLPAPGHPEA